MLSRGARGAKINAIEKAIEAASTNVGLSISLRGARMKLAGYLCDRDINTYNDLDDDELVSVEAYANDTNDLGRWLIQTYGCSERLPSV